MDHKQILELALETLERRRAEVEAAIAEVVELQGGNPRRIVRRPELPTLVVVKRRSRTQAERRAQSLRMKRIWAKKRAAQTGKEPAPSKPSPSGGRRKSRSAKSKAVSEGMRAYWAVRKAEEQKKVTSKE